MTTHITKTWFDGEKVVTQEIPESEDYKQKPVAWMDEFGNVFPLGAQRGPKYLNESMKPLYTTPPAAQPAPVQEPVAAQCKFDREVKWGWCEIAHHNLVQAEPQNWPGYQTRLLYTTPPAAQRTWVGLTDEQIEDEWERITGHSIFGGNRAEGRTMYISPDEVIEFARAIEAAHGIKGEA